LRWGCCSGPYEVSITRCLAPRIGHHVSGTTCPPAEQRRGVGGQRPVRPTLTGPVDPPSRLATAEGAGPSRRICCCKHPCTVNSRIVLLGTEQDFFLQLLEMLVPGGARDMALEAEERREPPPPPQAAPFQ